LRNIGSHRQHFDLRKIRPQLGRLLLDHFAADIDRHIGGELRRRAQQNARLLARAAAEFDERGASRNEPGDAGGVFLQDAHLAAGRVIFRQVGDALEQS
jgi:hypothetical protein